MGNKKFKVSLTHFNVISFSLVGYCTNSPEYKVTHSFSLNIYRLHIHSYAPDIESTANRISECLQIISFDMYSIIWGNYTNVIFKMPEWPLINCFCC